MYRKICLLPVIFALFFQIVSGQKPIDETDSGKLAELEKMASELLRETAQIIPALRSPQNRHTAILRTADALWNLDEPMARNLFQTAIADLKRSLAQIDGELNYQQTYAAGNLSPSGSQRETKRKINKFISMRSTLINTIAKYDVEMANALFSDTNQMAVNPDLKKRLDRARKNIESMLVRRAAEKDVTKAVEYGRKKLESGVSSELIGLLNTIYTKDAEKGAAFGDEILKKIKEGGTTNRSNYWMAIRLLSRGSAIYENIVRTDSNKNPLFSKTELSDLAVFIAESSLTMKNRGRSNIPSSALKVVEKYAPQKAAEVKKINDQRIKEFNKSAGIKTKNSTQTTNNSAAQQRQKNYNDFRQELSALYQSLLNKDLTHGERLEIIGIARSKISAVNDQSFRLSNLISLAGFANKAGESESAQSILSEAESLVNQQPKMREDFNANKMLANAYTNINPDKTFAIAETMAYMLNEIVESYAVYQKFSNNKNIIENGELLTKNYSRQFINYFSFAPTTTSKLAETDFQRLKNLPDKLSRTELRIESRLNLANSLLKAVEQNKKITAIN